MILTNLGDLKSVNRSWSNAIKLWLLPCLIQLSKGDELMDGLDFFPESESVWSIGQLGFEIQF